MSPAKNYSFEKPQTSKRNAEVHPVWRGVGFSMIVLIPVISWAATDVILKNNTTHNWFKLSRDMLAMPGQFLYNIFPDQLLYVKLTMFLFIAFLLYLIFLMFSSIITRIVMGGPERYDPYYVTPMAHRRKRR